MCIRDRTRLTDLDLSLSTQIDSIVNVDPAEAIMNFSWANYTYTLSLIHIWNRSRLRIKSEESRFALPIMEKRNGFSWPVLRI